MSHQNNTNLIITGFMGTGKSTVGRIVAERIGRRFVDMDDLIIERTGRSVPEIFQQMGEAAFRQMEADLCHELSQPDHLVVATGGGALIPDANRLLIQQHGNLLICLTASLEALQERLMHNDNRPLAQDWRQVERLYHQRSAVYRQIRLQIDSTYRTAEQTADAVIRLYQRELDRSQHRLMVQSPDGSYDILVARGLRNEMPRLLADYGYTGRIIIATNETLAPLYGETLVDSLPNAALVTIPDGEIHKNLATVEQLYHDFVAAGLDRRGLVIALGGGVVGDTVGYAAATYMRGVQLMQVPTSLLAMVDSSVGGKVGVDIPAGKNLVGAFKQPEMVIIDPAVLATLPAQEIRCGLAEAIKHGLLANPDLLNHLDAIAAGDADWLRQTIQVKVDVVQRDPFEQGERAHLNLGHTFAHAIERVSGYQVPHGEAVAMGLVAAAHLSNRISTLTAAEVAQITNLIQRVGLPVTLPDFEAADLWDAMQTDKKWLHGRSHFIILENIGQPAVVRDVPRAVVLEVLETLRVP